MIEERRKRYEKGLHEKYLQLYHNEQCYEELMQMLEGAYQDRSAELRRLDGRREKEPNWYRNRNMLGMTMYPKLFAGGIKRCDRTLGLSVRAEDYLSSFNAAFKDASSI